MTIKELQKKNENTYLWISKEDQNNNAVITLPCKVKDFLPTKCHAQGEVEIETYEHLMELCERNIPCIVFQLGISDEGKIEVE